MVYKDMPFRPRYTNKHEYKYEFTYILFDGNLKYYSVKTRHGYQIAEYYADNNMRWDAATGLQFLGKERVK
jgi:hypothetical protein|tara:strand:+ start:2526 stop:2738 length:213 start_codon:yes stop_codon:yes gene_type:complete